LNLQPVVTNFEDRVAFPIARLPVALETGVALTWNEAKACFSAALIAFPPNSYPRTRRTLASVRSGLSWYDEHAPAAMIEWQSCTDCGMIFFSRGCAMVGRRSKFAGRTVNPRKCERTSSESISIELRKIL
jgi:hypothetical protein